MSHIKNFKDWFRVYESAGFRYRPGMAIFEGINPGSLDSRQASIEELSTKMKDIKPTMAAEFDAFIDAWKRLAVNYDSNAGTGTSTKELYETWFTKNQQYDTEGELSGVVAKIKNEKYDPPTFSMTTSTYVISNAKGRKVPFNNGSTIFWTSCDNLLSKINAANIYTMFSTLNKNIDDNLKEGRTKDALRGDVWDKRYAPGVGKWYWPDGYPTFNRIAPDQVFLFWKGGLSLANYAQLKTSTLGGGIKAEDVLSDLKRLENKTATRKYSFYTISSVEKSAGDEYTDFSTTTIQVPVGGGTTAVQVKDDKQPLPGSSGLFAQGSNTPVPAKAAGQLEALQKILGQYSNITSIKVQGSASWEWTNGNTRDDAQNLALAKQRAEWFITKINEGTNKVATLWNPAETDKVVNGVKQVVGPGAIVQPTNDVKTAPDWRVTNFFITGDKVKERELPTEWITTTETGEISLKYDKITITEHIISTTWESPGLITSKGWGQEKGKKDIKADLKQSTKWDDLKAGQEIVINDKSDPPKAVGDGVDGKQIFVVGEGTEKNTLKVKLVITKDGQKSEKEIDNVSKDRYLREVKPKPIEGEDNL